MAFAGCGIPDQTKARLRFQAALSPLGLRPCEHVPCMWGRPAACGGLSTRWSAGFQPARSLTSCPATEHIHAVNRAALFQSQC
jgi:hypothetical protein